MKQRVFEWGFLSVLLVGLAVSATPLVIRDGPVLWPLLVALLVALVLSAFPIWLPLLVAPPLQWTQPDAVTTPRVPVGGKVSYVTSICTRWGGHYTTTGQQYLDSVSSPLRSFHLRDRAGTNLPGRGWRTSVVTLPLPNGVPPGTYRLRSNLVVADTIGGVTWRNVTVILVTEPFEIVA